MKRILTAILLLITGLTPAIPQGGIANFPQTLPPQTVVGRLGITPGPAQAIPMSQLAGVFGAKQSVTVNAKCDGATDDTAAINIDLAQGGYWTLPPGKTCNVTQLNITQNNTRLSGGGMNSSIIQGTTAGVPTLNVSQLVNVYLDGFQVTKSVVATSGGTGIKYNGECQYCVIDGVFVQKHWDGFALQSAGVSYFRHSMSQYNLHDGVVLNNSAVSGALQWDLDDVFSGQNANRGFFVTPGVGGPLGIALGSWHNVRTFGNVGVGAGFVGTALMPINGVRITKGFFGADGNNELHFDTYGGLHSVSGDTYIELGGTGTTGPAFGTPASHASDGIRITANNIDVTLGDLYINGNYNSGINTSATTITTIGTVHISNHNTYGILAADCSLIHVTGSYFLSNTSGNIQCTANSGKQIVAGSYPGSLNTVSGSLSALTAAAAAADADTVAVDQGAGLLKQTFAAIKVWIKAWITKTDVGLSSVPNVDMTNLSNATSGTVAAARGGAGGVSGALKGNGSGLVSQAACSDLSGVAASCATDATNATNISSGTLAVARGGTGVTTAAAEQARLSLGIMVAVVTGVNFNSANTDNAISVPLPTGYTRFSILRLNISHASGSLTTSTFGLFSTTGGGGLAIIPAGTANTVSTAADATANNGMTNAPTANGATMIGASLPTPNTIYFRVGTAQGSAQTGDIELYYFVTP